MSLNHTQYQARHNIFALLQNRLSELSGNKQEDIREESLVYAELNLTEFDLQRVVKEVGAELELDSEALAEAVADNDDLSSVGDVVDLLLDEKELG